MRVRMKGLCMTPAGTYRPDEVHDLPDEMAEQLIAAREAVAVDAGAETSDEKAEGEVASVRSRGRRG